MPKFTEQKEETGWKPSLHEVKNLEEKLKSFTKRVVNGRMQYPFQLYLEKENIISFGEFGEMRVINPLAYHRMNETDSLRDYIETKEMERLFQAFPEEKQAWDEKVMHWRTEIRDMFAGVSAKLKT